jgi:hypothetical protein
MVVSTCILKAISLTTVTDMFEVTTMEHCKNPWKSNCKSENIKLYIQVKGEKLPICKKCWSRIADKDFSWGD